ncbi:MAG: bifunctional 5,10-methylenetetrahydrofolate dehydrogenase/5,10-methenyltetrahydrofolate cyclohydrolase [Candidatus Paceibacterota bacterium]
MIINGRAIAEALKEKLKEKMKGESYVLTVFWMGDDPATRQFISIKRKVAVLLGVSIKEKRFDESVTTEELVKEISKVSEECDGIIVQFPLPSHVDQTKIRNSIPLSHDVDFISDEAFASLSKESPLLPPVVGAIKEIVDANNILIQGESVLVVGEGLLVGRPAALWFSLQGGEVSTANKNTRELGKLTKKADILVLGAGSPELITKDMVQEGVVIFDAGTSEAEGVLKGDAHVEVSGKASFFTPVPGGIGPITVIKIFENLYKLRQARI